jgi:hypothetical protein
VLLRVAAVALGVLLALALGELGLRVAALFSPDVRYLAQVPAGERVPRFATLAEYLASRPAHVVPHRPWLNYWTNALGFNDEEFLVPKPAGRFRIMAVGDSFTYGMVPYPQAVVTLLEARLRARCPGRDLDLLNFGIVDTGVHHYRTLVELAFTTYAPDLVLINLYAGNDGPNLHSRTQDDGGSQSLLRHSYLLTYTDRAVLLRRSLGGAFAARPPDPAPARVPPDARPRGGQPVDPGFRLPDDDPALVGPIFEDERFERILGRELGRLYVPPDRGEIDRGWQLRLDALEATRAHVTGHGGRLAIALYPSVLQVDARLRGELIERLRRRQRYADVTAAAIDPALPIRVLADYCRVRGLFCFEVTPALVRASQESPEPLYKTRDVHWTVRGNRVAAEAQADHLVPLVCPQHRAG